MPKNPTENNLKQKLLLLEKENARLKAANQTLKVSANRFLSFLKSADDAILICDHQAKPVIWNPAFENFMQDLFGVPMESGIELHKYLPGAEKIDWLQIINERVLCGEQYKTEQTFYSSDLPENNIRHLGITVSPIRENAPINGLSVLVRDITKQKLTEEKLINFKQATDASADAIGMSTADGNHYYQNEAFDNMFGDVGNDPPSTLYADETIGREVFETIMSGIPWIGEVEMNGKNNEILNILLRAYPTMDSDGNVRRLFGVHTDITKQKQTEKELRKHREHLQELVTERTRELQESEARFRQISDTINDVFYLYSNDYKTVYYVSQGFEKIWGKTIQELYDNPWIYTDSIHDDDRQRVEAFKKRIINTLSFKDAAIEYRIINTDENIRWIQDEMFPVYDLTGNISRIDRKSVV